MATKAYLRRQAGITRRDGLIISQALYEFVRLHRHYEATNDKRCEWSNIQDAVLILRTTHNGDAFREMDRLRGIEPVDLTLEKEGVQGKPELRLIVSND